MFVCFEAPPSSALLSHYFLMSQFQFKFDIPSNSDAQTQCAPPQRQEAKGRDSQTSIAEKPSKPQFQLIKNIEPRLSDRRNIGLDYVTIDLSKGEESSTHISPLHQVCSNVDTRQESDGILQDIDRKNTDLLPGVYEGGLKVWECSLDLCRHLALHCDELLAEGSKILELGCGHALPSCFLLREGLLRNRNMIVMLTDYNDFVLEGVTLSNIVLNTRELVNIEKLDSVITERIRLGAGDWMSMSNQLSSGVLQDEDSSLPQDGRFDVILAAETTYSAESANETAVLLARHLKQGSGTGLVACKRYYFGVGGGSDSFRQAAASQRIMPNDEDSSTSVRVEYRLSVETLKVYDNGAGNIRELLQIKCVPFE
jgi:predicted nicotinamide N-methyase